MSDQTGKNPNRLSDKDELPEEVKNAKKIQSEEGFGWTIDAEGPDASSVLPPSSDSAYAGRMDKPAASGAQPGSHGGSQDVTRPSQAPVSPSDQEAPAASHGLQAGQDTQPAAGPRVGLNAAPELPHASGISQAGALSGMPGQTKAFAAPPSSHGSAPVPDAGTPPPPGGTHTPPTPTGTTPPPGGTNTPPTPTGTTPLPGGTSTPPTPTGTTTTAAKISGLDTDTATEDLNVVAGNLTAGGLLTVKDPDAGQDKFLAVAAVQGPAGYGSFSIDENGRWTYTADNSQAVIQALKPGNSLIDRLTVQSADGTTHELRVIITGSNDVPVLKAATASATEDGSAVSGQMSAADVDS
ncbi:hypothetical protein E1178_00225, partial [Roseibium hamelinense]|uniref:VCBS domain-containing protein n=1 Tax=Roseibium hamelinense TaxID=150831 RepID=UPI0018AD1EDF